MTNMADNPRLDQGRGQTVFTFDDKAGSDFIRFMEDRDVHPVLVFGTRESGKSTMLLSLFSYAMESADAGIAVSLGQDPFPPTIVDAPMRYAKAQEFINVSVPRFKNGTVPPRTSAELPFFIPVDIEVRGFGGNAPKTTKLAILEGTGEWFEKDEEDSIDFKELKPEVISILKRFTNPISVIFIAPCHHASGGEKLDYSHRCLANSVREYRRLRNDPSRDNLLLLMSKWDMRYPPKDMHSNGFSNPTPELMTAELQRWKSIWNTFSTLGDVSSKSLLPYSAGMISGKTVDRGGKHEPVFDRYNRVLLNWVIGNAMQTVSKGVTTRPIIYPDAAPPHKVLRSRMDRAVDFILGRS